MFLLNILSKKIPTALLWIIFYRNISFLIKFEKIEISENVFKNDNIQNPLSKQHRQYKIEEFIK